ncbi:unnamed protein product [Arctogadus glacialis]
MQPALAASLLLVAAELPALTPPPPVTGPSAQGTNVSHLLKYEKLFPPPKDPAQQEVKINSRCSQKRATQAGAVMSA